MSAETTDPIGIAAELETRYTRYLQTLFHFRDPTLRASFESALADGGLSKGPFVEGLPAFARGMSPRQLLAVLGLPPADAFLKSIEGDRPLYAHQEAAIRAVGSERNAIVATGTGSGKTESFLLPILFHLYRQHLAGGLGPGVRALILYPMNALAHDQRLRLGEICGRLKEARADFQFTFGQYVGDTPEDAADRLRMGRGGGRDRLPGELLFREEMREQPPHLLLTNYSMLEYLLIRPDDSALFDRGRAESWSFLVLDEAHQYRGSRGSEMAMLIRRLKRRLREGGFAGDFRCIATSATLAGGHDDRSAVARFAAALFGEPFGPDEVILGNVESTPHESDLFLDHADYVTLQRSDEVASDAPVRDVARKHGVVWQSQWTLDQATRALLSRDVRASKLAEWVRRQTEPVNRLAQELFFDVPERERAIALKRLIELVTKTTPDAGPLLNVRYHLLLRSLEGAYVSYLPSRQVSLGRGPAREGVAFEVALCRECGQHYFVGQEREGKFLEARRDPGDPDFAVKYLRPLDASEDVTKSEPESPLKLCVRCGAIGRVLACDHSAEMTVVAGEKPNDPDRGDQLVRCDVCGYAAAGRDPVREIVHGSDGPNAVIATTLCQHLPDQRRRVLAFADGRQDAAFFAWYLQDSYEAILQRHLLLRTAKTLSVHTPDGLSPSELAVGLRHTLRETRAVPQSMGELDLRRESWLWVFRELLTEQARNSLEGVGSVRWKLNWPPWLSIPSMLGAHPWNLDSEASRQLINVLLNTLRVEPAVELSCEGGVELRWQELGGLAPQVRVRIGAPEGQKGVVSWDGSAGRRASYLAKLLARRGMAREKAKELAIETLGHIWETIRRCDRDAPSEDDRLLLSVGDAARLNPAWLRLTVLSDSDPVYCCATCGRLQTMDLLQVCIRHGCSGTVQPRGPDAARNHYAALYTEDLPPVMRVEEHTAQLDHEKAREFQQEFRDGKIHVLSCSTTFELGVDLGDLGVVFLRNVPPEPFNYIQRVGRAGRRAGHPGIAVTFCRRVPHDLYHFADPSRMLSGRTRVPTLAISNDKIVTRHMVAVALSWFFRAYPERFLTVSSLVGDFATPTLRQDLEKYLRENRSQLEAALKQIVSEELHDALGLTDARWIGLIAGATSRLGDALVEVSSDHERVRRLELESVTTRDYKTAGWARARAHTIATENVLSFLSRKVVIPKYGFPVDVVDLDTQRTSRSRESFQVTLQRDLAMAIAEFAPSSSLIANKKLWRSYGLKKVAEREWQRKKYKRCTEHNVFLQWDEGEEEPQTPCEHKLTPRTYVVPTFGFITHRDPPKEPTGRPPRVFSTRPYFVAHLERDRGVIEIASIRVNKAAPGKMVVLCEGRRGKGFFVCRDCGAGFQRLEKQHENPFGGACRGLLMSVSLGHEFVTDVLDLRFRRAPLGVVSQWFAHTLAYAIVEGAAETLEVPPTDLNVTVGLRAQGAELPPILLYDAVPGGAGLVVRLEEPPILKECLEAAHARVDGKCGCDEESSCYGCLRSFRNQFVHEHLKRGEVRSYLQGLLREWQMPTHVGGAEVLSQ